MAETNTDTNPPQDQTTTSSQQQRPPNQLYYATLDIIPPKISSLLETYSSVPPSSQNAHIVSARNKAYTHHPYPCLGRFRFLNLDLSNHPLYTTHLLPLLTRPADSFHPPHDPQFLDIGSCLGQDLRQLVVDGVPVSRIYGSDLGWGMIEAGYELFRDEDRFPRNRFLVPGDVLGGDGGGAAGAADGGEEKESALRAMRGRCDVVNANAVFHLFDRPQQVVMAGELVRLLRRDGDGVGGKKLLTGQQLGAWEAGFKEDTGRRYRHNEETWKTLWDELFEGDEWKDVVIKWEVNSKLQAMERKGIDPSYAWQVWWVWVEFR